MVSSNPFTGVHPSYDLILANIRLGHKYQIPKLVENALEYLSEYFTDDFAQLPKRRPWWYRPPAFRNEDAIGVINLAHITGERKLLPVAILICCKLGSAIIHGCERADGTREQLSLDDIGL